MEIKEVSEKYKDEWNKFVAGNSSPSSFLQAMDWGFFRRDCLGEGVRFYAVTDCDTQIDTNQNPSTMLGAGTNQHKLIAVALLVKKSLPMGRCYWECARGPVFNKQLTTNSKQLTEIFGLIFNEVKKTAREERTVFVRMEMPYEMNNELGIMNYGLEKPKILIHSINPKNTLLLDLTKSAEEILAGMHPKWRYNIRLAEKRKVEIRNQKLETRNQKDTDDFYNLLQETAKRDGIKIFDKKYYESLIESFCHPDEITRPRDEEESKRFLGSNLGMTHIKASLFLAEYQNKILSAIMVVGFGDTATYLHGGSSNEDREVMPNHAIQWVAIKWAKEQGYHYYDFWGISKGKMQKEKGKSETEEYQQNESWAGISRFKRGFVGEMTGQEINYIGALDIVLNKAWYNLYRMGKLIKF